ncbi:MAG: hypothetical protein HYZ27_05315 [Deltaproteobacteria bacterium]|nr:hypothetical protein [Deltaproteobacteria bacterium]
MSEKSTLGRIVVIAVYALIAGYFSVAILGSIVNQLYGKPPAHEGKLTQADRTWCLRALVGLRDEIEGQAALELQHPRREGDAFARWRLWEQAWIGKLSAARARCTGSDATLDQAYASLSELHASYAQAIERMIHARSEVADKLKVSLEALRGGAGP